MSLLSFGSLFGLPFLLLQANLYSRFQLHALKQVLTTLGFSSCSAVDLTVERVAPSMLFQSSLSQPFTLCHMYSSGRASQAVPSPTSSSQNLSPFLFCSFTPPPLAPETVPVFLSFYIHTHTHANLHWLLCCKNCVQKERALVQEHTGNLLPLMSIKDKVHMKYVYQYSGSAVVQWPANSSSRRTVNTGQP